MNKYPLWKYLLVLFVLAIGIIYSAPNLYPPDPSVQISGSSGGQILGPNVERSALDALKAAGIEHKSVELEQSSILIRLNHMDDQLRAKKVVEQALKHDYVVALNLAPTTPEWLEAIGAEPMKLGLDLSGGVHFLLEVDTNFAIQKRIDGYRGEIQKLLREERIRGVITEQALKVVGKFKTEELRDKAVAVVAKQSRELSVAEREEGGQYLVEWYLSEAKAKEIANQAVSQNLTALRNRVNELGVSEPLVQKQGTNRIVVELPGIQDSATAKRIIGKTANLEFRLESNGKGPSQTFEFRNGDSRRRQAALERSVVITGDQVSTASTSFDENGRAQVNITLDSRGGRQMHAATKNNIGRGLGVLFIERKYKTRTVTAEDGKQELERIPYYDKKIISLATVQSALGVQFRITGLDSPQEARELALLLRAGALVAPVDFAEERTIGPSLGEQNIAKGINAVMIGMGLVLLFMFAYYKVFGLFANVALVMNLVVLVAVMSIISATLTLPGIAGIVLTVGMAVDANVLIFERIKEEIRNGLSPAQAIGAGYDRAFVTIMDSNITTLLVAIILYAMGSGPIKGFAVTLSIGILTSMFTAIIGTRALVSLVYGNRSIKKLAI
ncbi:Protein translocase subunit SecD [BD1-7 clade bacterium]|uniref:Protein translocase subunit SecD n=1 Tax=BD1-7 clade bacterium TaxID=2029982 RepID=A0A5S9PAF9_9GAMM|nr:Protein translocase subunit SecD [BD1-7 clade bacterium]CAA0116243.1 Protein translocase subunit SecD [BD1-7 clade bacterium]